MEKVLQFSPNITAKIKITSEPLDINEALEFCSDSEAGGNFLFAGTTRGFEKVIKSDATVDTIAIRGLEYDCYLPMAIKELENICKESAEEFQEGIKNLYVCHKIGFVATREASILVCCSGGHRDAPMKAVRNIVNSLKSRVTIWKKFLPLEQNDSTFKETWLKQSEAFWLNNNSGQQQ